MLRTKIDYLAIGDYLVAKDQSQLDAVLTEAMQQNETVAV
jgi:hypothetical protein